MSKRPFQIIEKHREAGKVIAVTYEADFWEGSCEPGETGRYVRARSTRGADLVGVSPNVSFYDALRAAFK